MNTQLILNEKQPKSNIFKNIIVTNSLILIIASIIIKIISLLNRVYLTRLLGNYGIAIYTLILPTVMLFISIGGFSLNNTITKIVSENKDYSDYQIIKAAKKIAYLSSFITIIIFIISVNFIATILLNQKETIPALLYTIIFIPITSLNNVYRGFVAGKNEMKKVAFANVIEQMSRFFLTLILLYLFSQFGTYFSVKLTIIAMCFGELISLIYIKSKVKIKKDQNITNILSESNKDLAKKMIKLSFSTTITHLISNITMFLEPIIFTFALSSIEIASDDILLKYSEMNSFVLPTLTLLSFVTFQFSQALLPVLSKNAQENRSKANEIVMNKAIYLMIIIGIFLMFFYIYYAEDVLKFLYDTNIGAEKIKTLAPIFLISYILPIFIVYLQATNNYGYILKTSIFVSIIKLIIILIVGINKNLYQDALDISISLTLIISFTFYLIKIIKNLKIRLPFLKIIFILLTTIHIFTLISSLNLNFIFEIIISFLIFMLFSFLL